MNIQIPSKNEKYEMQCEECEEWSKELLFKKKWVCKKCAIPRSQDTNKEIIAG